MVYINIDSDGRLQAISNTYTSSTSNEASLDDDAFYFDKIEGYIAKYDSNGKLHLSFDENQYNTYLEAQKKAEQEAKEAEAKQKGLDSLADTATQIKAAISAVRESVSDDVAAKHLTLFDAWQADKAYVKDERVVYNGKLYKVLQSHTSQSNWTPDKAPSLFAEILTATVDPGTGEAKEDDVKEWMQPDSTNPYMKGDKVTYNGKTYESMIDNNTWAPDAYPQGWKEV